MPPDSPCSSVVDSSGEVVMTWGRALGYLAVFLGLVAYYVATEPRTGADTPAVVVRRSFLDITSTDVRALTVEQGTRRIRAVREGERWRVAEPEGTKIPSDLLAALVDQLATQPDVEVVDETGQDAAQFGLVPPVARVTLEIDDRKVGIAFGARNPGQTAIYGRVDGESRVLLLGLNVLYYEELIVQASGTPTG